MATRPEAASTALTTQEIVGTALDLIAEGGVGRLSMRHLSTRLGVSLGATYRHVATRDELLALCGRELFLRGFQPRSAGDAPVACVRQQLIRLYDAVCAHPGIAEYIVHRLDVAAPEIVEAVQAALVAAGVPPDAEETVRLVLTFYLTGVLLAGPSVLQRASFAEPRRLTQAGLDSILAGAAPPLSRQASVNRGCHSPVVFQQVQALK